jgi:tripartite ATP-independent transporter DctM subunit
MEIGALLLVTFLTLLFLGLPITISMGIAAVLALFVGGYTFEVLPLMISRGTSNYTLIAIPYFILAGNLMNSSGITRRIFDFASALMGHVKGGLAQVNVLASMIFAGISGTAVSDAAGLGLVEIDAMTSKGYEKSYSTAVTLASSVIGPIIPPSVPFLIFATLANVSVAKLFIGGLIPGVVVGLSLMITNYYFAVTGKVKMPKPVPFEFKRLIKTFKEGFFALLAPGVLIGGIMSGYVTATEAGILAVVYSLFVGLIYKELTWKNLFNSLKATIYSSALIMFLIGMGKVVGWITTAERVPVLASTFLFSVTSSKILLLIIIEIFLLILGMVIDGVTITLIMVPILLPIIDSIGMDRIQFGIVENLVGLIGMATPPVGVGLFIMSSITNLTIPQVVKAFMPFFIPLVIVLILLTYIPSITLWLPNLIF